MVATSPLGAGTGGRAPAADLLRALALLGSTVALALVWAYGRRLGPGGRPADGERVDQAVDLLTGLLVDNRVLPLFAAALGAGLAVRLRSPGAVGAVLRRAAVLAALGLVHAALVTEADILGTLAVLLLVGLPLAAARPWVAALLCVLLLPTLALQGLVDGVGVVGLPDPPAAYGLAVVDRVGTWLLALVLLPLTQAGLLLAVVVGAWLVRAGWLQHPAEHRRGLLAVAAVGAVVALVGAVPYARVLAAPAVPDVATAGLAGAASSLTAPAAGAAALAACALLVPWATRSAVGRALLRLGRASLWVYLSTSLALALVLAPWALGAGARLQSAALAALGALVWLVALLLALAVGRGRGAQPNERQGRARSSAT